MKRSTLIEIAASGLLAPSAANEVSFQFEYGVDEIVIWASGATDQEPTRYRHVVDLLGVGAVVENMVVRAQALGFEATVRWFPAPQTRKIARLFFDAVGAPRRTLLSDAIAARHTNRKTFRGPALTPVEKATMSVDAAIPAGTRVVWLEGAERRKALRLVYRAECERFSQKQLHAESSAIMRFDRPWDERTETRLPLGSLEIGAPTRAVFRLLSRWPVMRALNLFGAARLLGFRIGLLPCWQAPALGVIVHDSGLETFSDLDALACGRSFERLWLRCTALGLALQPLVSSTTMLFQSDADQASRARNRQALADGWREILGPVTPLVLFRAGRAAPASVRTGRPAIESLERPSAQPDREPGIDPFAHANDRLQPEPPRYGPKAVDRDPPVVARAADAAATPERMRSDVSFAT